MTTVFDAEKFAGLPSSAWRTKELQHSHSPCLGLREGDLKEINLSEAAHLPLWEDNYLSRWLQEAMWSGDGNDCKESLTEAKDERA